MVYEVRPLCFKNDHEIVKQNGKYSILLLLLYIIEV